LSFRVNAGTELSYIEEMTS